MNHANKKPQAKVRPRVIVGFAGLAGSGKSTAAKLASEILQMAGYWGQHINFADPLKRFCGDVLGLSRDQLYGDDKETVDAFWCLTPRQILQRVGTDALRTGFRSDVWCKCLERRVLSGDALARNMKRDTPNAYVVGDVRFPDEKETIERLGGFCLWVDRPDLEIREAHGHISEQLLGPGHDWAGIIDNSGTKADLESRVAELLVQRIPELLAA